jgi:hypothetical protein
MAQKSPFGRPRRLKAGAYSRGAAAAVGRKQPALAAGLASGSFMSIIIYYCHFLPRHDAVHQFPFTKPRASWAATERVILIKKQFLHTAI